VGHETDRSVLLAGLLPLKGKKSCPAYLKGTSMEPIAEKTLPLSVAALDAGVSLKSAPELLRAPDGGTGATANLSSEQKKALAAVTVRAGAVEAAEWALDQAKAVCDEEIRAAITAGVPTEIVSAAAGVCAAAVVRLGQDPATDLEAS
jgi:hypothetical protein